MSLMRMKLPAGRRPATGRSWPVAAFGDRSRIADLRRTSISPPAAFGKIWEPRLPAMSCRSPSTQRRSASCALPTSEKAGSLIAKRPERQFSLGAATVQISAEAVTRGLIRRLPLWIGYRSSTGESPERQLSDLLSDRTRPSAAGRITSGEGLVCNKCGLL
jgi:hypothetical protein